MDKGQRQRWFWSAVGVAQLVWDLWEILNALRGHPTLIGDLLGSEYSIQIYAALAIGAASWIAMWNYQVIRRVLVRRRVGKNARRPENRSKQVEILLQTELLRIDRAPIFPMTTPAASGYIARENIRRKFFHMGVFAPDSNSSDQIYYAFLANQRSQ